MRQAFNQQEFLDQQALTEERKLLEDANCVLTILAFSLPI
jgi:hypothetical protein